MTVADAPLSSTDPVRVREIDGLSVMEIPAEGEFVELRDWLRESLPAVLDSVGGRACRLDLGTRPIQLFDLRRLVNLLRDDFSIDVTGVYVSGTEVWQYAERELKLRLFDNSQVAEEEPGDVSETEEPEEPSDESTDGTDGVDDVDLEDAPETTLSSVHIVVETPASTAPPASKPGRRIPGPRTKSPNTTRWTTCSVVRLPVRAFIMPTAPYAVAQPFALTETSSSLVT